MRCFHVLICFDGACQTVTRSSDLWLRLYSWPSEKKFFSWLHGSVSISTLINEQEEETLEGQRRNIFCIIKEWLERSNKLAVN